MFWSIFFGASQVGLVFLNPPTAFFRSSGPVQAQVWGKSLFDPVQSVGKFILSLRVFVALSSSKAVSSVFVFCS